MRYYLATIPPGESQTTAALVADDGRSLTVPIDPPEDATDQMTAFLEASPEGEPEVWSYNVEQDGEVCPVKCHDLKAWAAAVGNPTLPALPSDPNNAQLAARWTQEVYYFLFRYGGPESTPPTEGVPPTPLARVSAGKGAKKK